MFVDVVLVKVPQDTAPAGIAVLIGESESSLARIFLLLPAFTSLEILSKSGEYEVSLVEPDVVLRF